MAMNSWRGVLGVFLDTWRKKDGYEGAIVSGSFVTGDNTVSSDIDVHIIMNDTFHKKEKGLQEKDGFLISYVAFPVRMFPAVLKKGHAEHERIMARYYTKGEIVEDINGEVLRLKKMARQNLSIPLESLEAPNRENGKYVMVAVLDDLRDMSDEDPYFYFLYYLLLEYVVRVYAMFLGLDMPNTIRSYGKLERFFHDKDWRKRYLINDWKDDVFVRFFEEALAEASFEYVEALVSYVVEKMGGFDKADWKLKTSVD